jgi:hypothetical protein
VTKANRAFVECVKVHTESGKVFRFSTTAPIKVQGGADVWAEYLLGEMIMVKIAGRWQWSRVTFVEPIGMQWVMHITCDNLYFLVGDEPDAYTAHHNIKYTPDEP